MPGRKFWSLALLAGLGGAVAGCNDPNAVYPGTLGYGAPYGAGVVYSGYSTPYYGGGYYGGGYYGGGPYYGGGGWRPPYPGWRPPYPGWRPPGGGGPGFGGPGGGPHPPGFTGPGVRPPGFGGRPGEGMPRAECAPAAVTLAAAA